MKQQTVGRLHLNILLDCEQHKWMEIKLKLHVAVTGYIHSFIEWFCQTGDIEHIECNQKYKQCKCYILSLCIFFHIHIPLAQNKTVYASHFSHSVDWKSNLLIFSNGNNRNFLTPVKVHVQLIFFNGIFLRHCNCKVTGKNLKNFQTVMNCWMTV